MQNKGFVKIFAVLLTLICIFYLSFSFVTRHYESKAAAMGKEEGAAFLDSVMKEKVYLNIYTLKECREMEIGLGLDLKGGMNVILEVSVPDVVKTLADHKTDKAFNDAVANAAAQAEQSQKDFITLFVSEYHKLAPNSRLAEIFATQQLKGKVSTSSSDSEVESVLREEVKAAVDNSYNVLRTRIDRFGVAQPNIQTLEGQTGRIMVEMPGIKEPERVRKLLQGSANLEFWETYDANEVYPFLVSADEHVRDIIAGTDTTAKAATADTAAVAQSSAKSVTETLSALTNKSDVAKKSSAIVDKEHPLLSKLNPANYGCVVGYAVARDTADINKYLAMAKNTLPSDLSLKWGVKGVTFGEKNKTEYFELYAIKVTQRDGRAPLEGDVVTDAKDEFDHTTGRPCVSMQMNSDGARRWAALTKANVEKSIAIVLDGLVYSAPTVHNEINGGNSQITGNFTPEDTKDLANVLKSGKMPAPTHIVQEDIVGPSLGQESINQGITSFVIAFIILMIYMCAMYGFTPGMVANGALVLNFFFTLGVLTSFQAALTMSGIAGMVLSLGMAVDANVLIYERTKEEMKAGKHVADAISAGYSNAFSAIFDSNLTSIITGVILFYFGTGPIRGFATTLIIGIVCSFFTAVFLTRMVFEHFLKKEKWTNLTFTTGLSKNLMTNTHFHFMGAYKKSFTVFGILLVACVASFFVRGLSKSIDFTGGRNYVVRFEKQVEPETVRSLVAAKSGEANVSCIALGTDHKTIRISTNYKIESNSTTVDSEIEALVFEALKGGNLLASDVDLARFIDRDNQKGGSIISSQKVGPSIAEDITFGAILSVGYALQSSFTSCFVSATYHTLLVVQSHLLLIHCLSSVHTHCAGAGCLSLSRLTRHSLAQSLLRSVTQSTIRWLSSTVSARASACIQKKTVRFCLTAR